MISRSVTSQNLGVAHVCCRFGVGVGNIYSKGLQAFFLVFSHQWSVHGITVYSHCTIRTFLQLPAYSSRSDWLCFRVDFFWRVQCPVMWSIVSCANLKKQKGEKNLTACLINVFFLLWELLCSRLVIPQDLTCACLEHGGGSICILIAEGSVLFLPWRAAVQWSKKCEVLEIIMRFCNHLLSTF